MCNLYTQSKSVDEVARLFRDGQMPLTFPEGVPNLQPREIAITDPRVYSKPWKVSMPLTRDAEYRMFEYACHEGNRAIGHILAGARAEERR